VTRAAAAAASASTSSGAARAGGAAKSARVPRGYLACSELPLASLVFLLPLIVLYEVGTWRLASDPVQRTEQRIIAFTLMRQFFSFFGATAHYLPALTVAGILLAWHVLRRDSWHVHVAHVFGMAVESIILAGPLLIIAIVFVLYVRLAAGGPDTSPSLVVLSIGAGIYEEFLFRLVVFWLLGLLLIDVFGMRKFWAYLLMVLTSALSFSIYHYLGNEPFQARTFAFRTGAGLYFGAVFAFRGFGITAGSHAAYDMIVVLMRNGA
jgi:hypothetical protein